MVDVCGCKQDWSPASFIESTVAELKAQLGDDKVVLGLGFTKQGTHQAMDDIRESVAELAYYREHFIKL